MPGQKAPVEQFRHVPRKGPGQRPPPVWMYPIAFRPGLRSRPGRRSQVTMQTDRQTGTTGARPVPSSRSIVPTGCWSEVGSASSRARWPNLLRSGPGQIHVDHVESTRSQSEIKCLDVDDHLPGLTRDRPSIHRPRPSGAGQRLRA